MSGDDKRTVADRVAAAGLDTDRFINVIDGEKGTHDHDTRYADPRDVPGQNYGIYPGDGLVDVDIDDYSDATDNDGLEAILALPETFTVQTPHTDGDPGGHRYYVVEGDVVEALEREFGTANPQPSWGEVRAHNQYVVGPGSQLDGCDKEWCDECATPDGGWYRVATDAPIATITAEQLVDALQADPDLDTSTRDGRPPGDGGDDGAVGDGATGTANYDPTGTPFEDVIDADSKLATYLAAGAKAAGFRADGGGDDRSRADYYAACRATEYGVAEAEIRDALADCEHSKVGAADAPNDYWARTWSKAVTKADANSDAPDTPAGPIEGRPTWKHVAEELGVDLSDADGRDDALSGYTDKALAGALWTCIDRSDAEIRVIEATDGIWYYDRDRGVWSRDGDGFLASLGRTALGPTHYGNNVLSELRGEAAADDRIRAHPDDFGVDPGQVLVENGLLDLQAAYDGAGMDALADPSPDDLAMRLLPVEFDPDADADEWTEYVEEWAEDGRAATLQEYVGYCLHVGGLPIHRALLIVGEGRNGKGTFLHVIRQLLGEENTTSIDLQTLAKRTFARPAFHTSIANIDDDLSSASFGAGGLGMFKKLVAGDPVWAERKGKDGYSFTPTGKHLYAANTVPDVNVSDDDAAFWERWEVVEFPNYYAPDERDPDLRHRLAENHLSGVLNWAIEGWARLMDRGRFTGELETWEKRDYWRRYGETIDQFIDECLTHDVDAPNVASGDVYQVYVAYCEANTETPDSQHKLTGKLKAAGYTYKESVRIGDRTPRGFTNLAFTDDAPVDEAGVDLDPDHKTDDRPQDRLEV